VFVHQRAARTRPPPCGRAAQHRLPGSHPRHSARARRRGGACRIRSVRCEIALRVVVGLTPPPPGSLWQHKPRREAAAMQPATRAYRARPAGDR
jgi:hypothetical protein